MKKLNKQFLSGQLTLGNVVNQFEEKIKEQVKTKYVVATSSCSSSLLVTLKFLKLKKNDEVITTPLTFASTVHSIILSGAKPVLCDVNKYGNIDLNQVKKKITKKTKAILIVNYGGLPCDLSEFKEVCKKKKIFFIQDCAHSLGSKYKNQPVSKYSDASCYSFYQQKILQQLRVVRFMQTKKNYFYLQKLC